MRGTSLLFIFQRKARSAFACGWININTLLQLCHPCIRLISSHMLAAFTKGFPSLKAVLSKRFAFFFSVAELRGVFEHQPVRCALAPTLIPVRWP